MYSTGVRQTAIRSRRYDSPALMESQRTKKVYQYHFANDFFYLVVLLFSKLAVCFLFLRLTRRKEHIVVIYTTIGLCGAWFLLSILLISIGSSWETAFSIPVGFGSNLAHLGHMLIICKISSPDGSPLGFWISLLS
jgi:hypothetical protein